MGKRIGRFEIKRELGRGAQSAVYLAHDPQLDRDVAVKTLHLTGKSSGQNEALLAEARIVSRLRHPGIVPIFDVGIEQGDPYLVFEFVPGEDLQRYMRRRGALPASEAVHIMTAILEAIAAAHDEGVIHRDLKPTNILMDERGTPRVMDFGIARRISDDPASGSSLSGTPSYMAPEYIASHEIGPRTDVFAAGLILIELATGRRVFGGKDPQEVMRRIASEPVRLPEGAEIDERLAGIALSATAFDPLQRYQTPRDFLKALHNWEAPSTDDLPPAASTKGTLEFLLRRMRHKSDFPALSESVSAINRIAASEHESVDKLSGFILRDFSLTNKLLRLVNSTYFRRAGAGNISTISRAVLVLGFDTVRNIAITVLLFEHLQNKNNADQLKEEFLLANFGGALARDLSRNQNARDHEQVYICALFHNLGRLLAQFYFPEECDEIRREATKSDCSEEVASLRVLGMSFAEIGIGVARSWGFPQLIVDSMQRLPPGPVRRSDTPAERLRVLSGFANEAGAAVATMAPAEREQELKRIAERYAQPLALSREDVNGLVRTAIGEVSDFARVIRINLGQTRIGQNLRAFGKTPVASAATEAAKSAGDDLNGSVLEAGVSPMLDTGNFGDGGVKAIDPQAVLTAGIQDISNTMVDDFRLNDVLRIILETMYRGMGFRRVLLCIKDPRNRTMQGRFGFGPGASELARKFTFSLEFTPDIFHAAMKNGVDILISDVDEPKIAPRIPDWFRKAVTAKTFVIFPLNIKQNPVALIYADKEKAGEIEISEKELSLLRTLRNQAVLAIKQAT
ncbi:MAG TPA: HDOD domain-containing protein [Rhodocyclaceae bacterium]|nr:HDOD domain-containing protein [Rhodocyclaceae bacterium]